MNERGIVAETSRLRLRLFTADDAEFLCGIHHDPDFLRFVGDRGVRTLEDARLYIEERILGMVAEFGFGLYVVEDKSGVAMGINGLIRRPGMADVDIGFAFLPAYRGQGYALESAQAVLAHARALGIERVVAITSEGNVRSESLLAKLGLVFERTLQLRDDTTELRLFGPRTPGWESGPDRLS